MKSKIRRRILAMMLCLSMVLNGSVSLLADDTTTDGENVVVENTVESETTEEVVEGEITEDQATTDETPENMADETTEEEVVEEEIVEMNPITLTWSEDGVTVTVTGKVVGAIPEGATLNVTPIVDGDEYTKVETQLQEKAENEEYEIAGFFAYDICLNDADGNEIEPNDNVNVSIVYDQAVIPEMETTEDAELDVTVMHFEEDEKGEVAQIVDAEADVTTTEATAVQSAEFNTSSFSVFTITWVEGAQIKAYCVNTSGASIGEQEFVINNINITSETSVADLSKDITDYSYVRAYVASSATSNSKTEISRLRYNEGVWEYSTVASGDSWTEVGELNLYFAYSTTANPARVPVADSVAAGIQINLYNYKVLSGGINSKNNGFYFHSGSNDGGIDRSSAQQAGITIDYGYGGSKGEFTSAWPQDVYQNYLRYNLGEDGYPILNSSTNTSYGNNNRYTNITSDSSLNYLFAHNPEHVTAYTNVNGLFQKDSNGYYYYYSNENHAQYNLETNTVDIYDSAAGDFLPFNNYSDASNSNYKSSRWDLWFGMNINTSFYQPVGGKIDGNDMIFEFSGDDDVWLFIDGVKVLDIGGIHDEKDGSINFATGVVSVEGKSNTTLAAIYRTAYYEKYPNATTAQYTAYMDEIFNKDANGNYTTYKDYSGHTFKFFYFERGAGSSNCKIKFNIPTVEAGTVQVEKQLTNTDKEKYANVEFAFQLWAQKVKSVTNGTEIYEVDANGNEVYEPITGAVYSGTKNPITFKTATFDEQTYQNVFYLKSGEVAEFTDLQENRKYFVREVGVEADEYDVIVINGVEYKAYDGEHQLTGSIIDVETNKAEVSKRPIVICENNCSAYNSRELRITKTMKTGQSAGSDTFSFKIMLENQEGVLEAYVGKYYLKDSNGNYYYYNTSGVLTNNGKEAKVCGETSSKGIVSGVPEGYTVVVTQILSGTDFLVQEVNLSDKYGEPVKTLIADTYAAPTLANAGSDGSILLGEDAEMTIENSLSTSSIRFTKQFKGPNGSVIQAPADVASIELKVLETYDATNDSEDYSAEHTIQLTKGTDGTFSGTLEGVQVYTDFTVIKETIIDTSGNRLVAYDSATANFVNTTDWTMEGYTLDRFSDNEVSAEFVASYEDTYYDLSATGYVLVKQANTWYLVLKYKDSVSDASIEKILDAVEVNPEAGSSIEEAKTVQVISPEEAASLYNATVTYKAGGITTLQFTDESVWTQFYHGKFETRNLVIEGVVTNKLDGTTQVSASKIWDDGNNYYGKRPASITVSVLNGDTVVTTITLSESNQWVGTSAELPKYNNDGTLITYTLREENNETGTLLTDYWVEIDGSIITNHLNYEWTLIKRSTTSEDVVLQGAEFTLTSTSDSGKTYYGLSDGNGVVNWYTSADYTLSTKVEDIETGEYTLAEVVAPVGYSVNTETWTLTFERTGGVPTVTKVVDGEVVDIDGQLSTENPLYEYEFTNEPLYSLPQSGGFGIYVYMIGGIMLMAFATLILYKNRRKEVVARY